MAPLGPIRPMDTTALLANNEKRVKIRSPDLTPCDFFLWGYVNDKVYVPPMPKTLQALQERIIAAVTDIDGNMLLNVWTELDYRWDMCRVTKGAHIEHLQYVPETW
ncbi:hypothetical protein AVEN_55492-1 [Araneus ventricosus]|uniref:Uncharacterized protein n=1 Tax=Araneus ventricosus TaxID=182803 RepID=A0A4Y2C953_ARAVE|nr:hypothetical protein AVEN_55492-1 [Araneus ventricosus]